VTRKRLFRIEGTGGAGVACGGWLEYRDLIPAGTEILLLLQCTGRLWGPPSLISDRFRGSFTGNLTTHSRLVPKLTVRGAVPLLSQKILLRSQIIKRVNSILPGICVYGPRDTTNAWVKSASWPTFETATSLIISRNINQPLVCDVRCSNVFMVWDY
jgi:hypothetical protein